jgi:(1->4)-alpha-D-glucan 1-alpha-D-glucosylmutase
VEDRPIFDAVHAKIFEGIREGWITGLRVDHPDGLYDPAGYFAELRRAARSNDIYVVAEKIMGSEEPPRKDWAIDGTTGYEFLNEVNGLFVNTAGGEALNRIYERFTKRLIPFPDLAYESKRLILRVSLSSEVNVLSRRLDRICQQHRHTRDFTLESLRFALTEVIACFPVYRTYVTQTQLVVDEEDRRQILLAVGEAKRRNPAVSESIFNSIASILVLEDPSGLSAEQKAERRLFVMRFQQLTGAVMAKGVEDTAFYRQFPLASLNEVGGDPQRFGVEPHEFHARIRQWSAHWPHSLLATSTHDTKRSEDVRARLNVLSEIPNEWETALQSWSRSNEAFSKSVNCERVPDPEAEYLTYQTLAGMWPLDGVRNGEQHGQFVRRIQDYMEKAVHEAKIRTSWVNPNTAYDSTIRDFVAAVLRPSPDNTFLPDIEEFSLRISAAGLWNGLSQTVLKLTCPGVPDIYQGNELWTFSLVDPDNRRPVDYARRKHLLAELPLKSVEEREAWVTQAAKTLSDGRIKLFITAALARFRRDQPDLFAQGDYVPLEAIGKLQDHVVAFARSIQNKTLIVAVARFFVRLGCRESIPAGDSVWDDQWINIGNLSGGAYRDLFSGRTINTTRVAEQTVLPVSQVFFSLPVSVLIRN